LIVDYRALLDRILGSLDAGRYDAALALVRLPEQVRGFGPV